MKNYFYNLNSIYENIVNGLRLRFIRLDPKRLIEFDIHLCFNYMNYIVKFKINFLKI